MTSSDLTKPDEVFLKRLEQIVLDNLHNEQFGVNELAQKLGLCRSYLYRKVHLLTGKSASQIIREIRLKEAYKLLKNENVTAAEVAYRVGFSTPSYFNLCFHKFYGFPPGQTKHQTGKNTDENLVENNKVNGSWVGKRLIKISVILLFIIGAVLSLTIFKKYFLGEQEKSVAVFTFSDHSPEKKYSFILNGLMEEILYKLSMVGGLRVVARTGDKKDRNSDSNIDKTERELDVDYLLEGSFQEVHDSIKLNVRLMRKADGRKVWSNEFVKHKTELFSLQSDIAHTVAEELQVAITLSEDELFEKMPAISLNSYDLYLKGRAAFKAYQMNHDKREALDKAEEYYRQALMHDPDYAGAYAGLAMVYLNRSRGRSYFSKDLQDSMMMLADLAINCDENAAEAYCARGFYYWLKGDHEKSVEQYNQSLELNPHLWEAYRGKGLVYIRQDPLKSLLNYHKAIFLAEGSDLKLILKELFFAYLWNGFVDEAHQYNREALRLSGDSVMYFCGMGAVESQQGNYIKAIKYYERGYEIDSGYYSQFCFTHDINRQLGFNHMMAGHYEASWKYYSKWLLIINRRQELCFNEMNRLAYVLWKNGKIDRAQYYFNGQWEYCEHLLQSDKSWKAHFAHYDLAALYAFMGDQEKAYKELRLFGQIDYPPLWMVTLMNNDPLFESIRNEASFQQITAEVEHKHKEAHDRLAMKLKVGEMSIFD